METSTSDWDIDEYKSVSESEEQWILRRKFMERWKNEIPKDRLVCLARVFTNIEYLGCRYPAPVMAQIAKLSQEVAHDFREKRKKRIQRTFVSASDAAEDRAKGTKRPYGHEESAPRSAELHFVAAGNADHFENPQPTIKNPMRHVNSRIDRQQNIRCNANLRNCASQSNKNRRNEKFIDSSVKSANVHSVYGNLVLFDRLSSSNISRLVDSCQTSKVKLDWQFDKEENIWRCKCFVNESNVFTETGETQKLAKEKTAEIAWKVLQKHCYTIIRVQKHFSKDDKKITIKEVADDKSKIDPFETKVESTVASRMMKLMGWKGGSLGVTEGGISEPIMPNLKQIHRAGLGSQHMGKPIRFALTNVIRDFKDTSSADFDLVFANDFTKEERAEMHQIALKCGLKSRSYGLEDERYLVISKCLTPAQLVQTLLDSGGSNDKFQLIYPNSETE